METTNWKFPLDGIRHHQLMTKAIAAELPGIGSTDGQGFDAKVGVKFFSPFGRYTFYVTEFDGADTLYGYCVSPLGEDCDEWGYASLSELAAADVWGGVPAIERDKGYGGVTVAEALGRVAA